tara:strand:+ start:670 stop:1533 length:864 start_codon:yes stop_codon:yes gene_type:complete
MAKAGAFTSRARVARRDIVTPEGMPVPVFLAVRSQRAGALFFDLLFMLIALIVIGLIAASIFSFGDEPGLGTSFYLLISFVLRNFYFIIFELYWRGATPGKRIMGLRVIDRGGGRLKADAIFARNLMREVEIFMPLSLLFSGTAVGSEAWVMVLTLAWVSIFTLLPLFNRERLRAGDMVGGTWVVSVPKKRLRQDLAEGAATATAWQRSQSKNTSSARPSSKPMAYLSCKPWRPYCAMMAKAPRRRAGRWPSASSARSAGRALMRPIPRIFSTPITRRYGRISRSAC